MRKTETIAREVKESLMYSKTALHKLNQKRKKKRKGRNFKTKCSSDKPWLLALDDKLY